LQMNYAKQGATRSSPALSVWLVPCADCRDAQVFQTSHRLEHPNEPSDQIV